MPLAWVTCVKLQQTMDDLSPDFVSYWLGSDLEPQPMVSGSSPGDEARLVLQSDALQALAERVAAARSVL